MNCENNRKDKRLHLIVIMETKKSLRLFENVRGVLYNSENRQT
jgi:hypothetical protein